MLLARITKFFFAFSLLFCVSAFSGSAQGLAPSAPTKEYVYFNGRLVAVEERGPADLKMPR